MQFKPELAQKIIAGRKTQTRRPVKDRERLHEGLDTCFVGIKLDDSRERIKWLVGQDYAVQPGRGEFQIARIKLLGIGREDCRYISQQDAEAEGFNNPLEFLQVWTGFYDPVGAALLDAGEPDLSTRPDSRYDCWVLKFELYEIAGE